VTITFPLNVEEEMADDRLKRKDIENAILRGKEDKRMTRDMRGTRYRIAGPAEDGRLVHVVCRFKEVGGLIFITVYAVRGAAMICEFCGGSTAKKAAKKQHWLKAKLYIVENVEAEVCTQCGERYFYDKTLDAIDKLLESDHEVRERLDVEVVPMR